MSTGVGIDVEMGFAIEANQNTRETPDTFFRAIQEGFKRNQNFIYPRGLGGGKMIEDAPLLGTFEPSGSYSFEAGTTQLEGLLRLATGLNPTPTGVGPYTRAYAGLNPALESATFDVVRPHGAGQTNFSYVGSLVNQLTVSQSPNQICEMQVELHSYDEVLGATPGVFAPPVDPQYLTFRDVAIDVFGGGAECFDSFTFNINNNLTRSAKVCVGDAGRTEIRRSNRPMITGTLTDDFKDLTHYNQAIAGTVGTLTFTYTGAAGSSLAFSMKVHFTPDTPNVSGPGEVKQGIPFKAVSNLSDADAFTMTLVNGEAA